MSVNSGRGSFTSMVPSLQQRHAGHQSDLSYPIPAMIIEAIKSRTLTYFDRFYIGSNVFDWPLQALRAVDDGHQICVHTWSHR